jgi:hypothetical protein
MNDNNMNMNWYPIAQFNIKLKSGDIRLHRLMKTEVNLFWELSQKYGVDRAFQAVTPWYADAIESFELKIEFYPDK